MPAGYNALSDMAALVQRDMVQQVKRARPAKARTLATFTQGTRKKVAGLAGIIIPFIRSFAEGSSNYNPNVGDTSFHKSTKEQFGAMYGGVVFRSMHLDFEASIGLDMERGKIPDSYIEQRKRAIDTYMMEKNWAAIGPGSGAVAYSSGTASGTTLTVLASNPGTATGRGFSKGVFRLFTSTSENPIYYSAINTSTGLEVARFYITAKLSSTTCTVNFTGGIGAITDLAVANLAIVKTKTGYLKEMIGLGGHISNASSGIYQGADRAVDTWLQCMAVDGGNGAPTPTLIDSLKNIGMTRNNNMNGRKGFICHITPGNWSLLCSYGFLSSASLPSPAGNRVYNAEKGGANTTYGVPDTYKDGDTEFAIDPDYEDTFIDLREKAPYFEYVHKEFGLKRTDGVGRQEWIGANGMGSTESYENYTENVNIVYDGQGADPDAEGGGMGNSAVYAYNVALPTIKQSTHGILM